MEGGAHGVSAEEFKTFWSIIWKNPFILQLALSAGVGGLLFGCDTGNFTDTYFSGHYN
jgi:SP family myo-inositol transporter-like MFS transporter 13